MDNFETKPTGGHPGASDLQAQCDALRQLVTSLLIVLLIVSGTLTVFLVRQWKFSKNELDASKQVLNEYTRTSGPAMQAFVRQLADYGRAHPDFAPIAAKYRLNEPVPRPSTSAPLAAPAPRK